jgi:RNA polymerase sigma factor FliA
MPRDPLPPEHRDALVIEHLELVRHAVQRMAARYPRHVDRDELWNAGALGLVDASRRYDPTTGVPFAHYALIRIRGAVIDATRSRDWATRSTRRDMRAVLEAEERLAGDHRRTPTDAEVAAELGVSVEQLDATRAAATASTLLHLDQRLGVDAIDGAELTLGDTIEEQDPVVLPEETLEQRELIGTLRTAVRHLPPTLRQVVERYYFAGDYLHVIADALGVTEARVSQLRSEALAAVRAYLGTHHDGVPTVDDRAPGRRARERYVDDLRATSTWRSRLAAADGALEPCGATSA